MGATGTGGTPIGDRYRRLAERSRASIGSGPPPLAFSTRAMFLLVLGLALLLAVPAFFRRPTAGSLAALIAGILGIGAVLAQRALRGDAPRASPGGKIAKVMPERTASGSPDALVESV